MRIVIDLQPLQARSRNRGIGRYASSLTEAICRNAGRHEIRIVLSDSNPAVHDAILRQFSSLVPRERILFFALPRGFEVAGKHKGRNTEINRFVREEFIASLEADVVLITEFHSSEEMITSIPDGTDGRGSLVATILYDLIPFRFPEQYLRSEYVKQYYSSMLEYLKRADMLFAISESSRNEGLEILGLPEERIVNISSAVDGRFTIGPVDDNVRDVLHSRLGIRGPFLLYVPGGFDFRKNISGLLDAYSLLPEGVREQYQLVIAGKLSPDARRKIKKADSNKFLRKKRLILTDYLSDEELILLYRTCRLFVYPSLAEGFGLPVLEAMGCGAPVVGSRRTSIPEIIGLEEGMFNPEDPADMARMVERGVSDEEFRNVLLENSRVRSGLFSWDRSARSLIAHLETLFSSAGACDHAGYRAGMQDRYDAALQKFGKISKKQRRELDRCLAHNVPCRDNP